MQVTSRNVAHAVHMHGSVYFHSGDGAPKRGRFVFWMVSLVCSSRCCCVLCQLTEVRTTQDRRPQHHTPHTHPTVLSLFPGGWFVPEFVRFVFAVLFAVPLARLSYSVVPKAMDQAALQRVTLSDFLRSRIQLAYLSSAVQRAGSSCCCGRCLVVLQCLCCALHVSWRSRMLAGLRVMLPESGWRYLYALMTALPVAGPSSAWFLVIAH